MAEVKAVKAVTVANATVDAKLKPKPNTEATPTPTVSNHTGPPQDGGKAGDASGKESATPSIYDEESEPLAVQVMQCKVRGALCPEDFDPKGRYLGDFEALRSNLRLDFPVIQKAVNYPIINMATELDDILFGLCVACIGNTSLMKKIVNNLRWDMTVRGPAGLTPVWLAAWNNHLDIVEILAKVSINFNSETNSGITPLMIAAAEGHTKMAELLVSKGANVHAVDIDGRSALDYAKNNDRKDIVDLLEASAKDSNTGSTTSADQETAGKVESKPGTEHLVRAAGFGDKKTAAELLVKGVDLKAPDRSGCLPIVAAAAGGDRDTVQLFIDKKAPLNESRPDDFTPLTAAAGNGHSAVVEALLKSGAEVNLVDGFGRTALIAAALFSGNSKTIDLLLDKGADVNLKVKEYSPLTAAIYSGSFDAVKQLIKKGAKVTPTEGEDRSLLWFAAASGNVKMAEFIFGTGAEVDNTFGSDYLPLLVAAERGHLDMVKLLLNHNADINARDSHGCTALFKAADRDHSEVAKLLVKEGADVNVICGNSVMPIHRVARNFDPELLKLLIRHGADLDFRDDYDNSPLLVAALNGDPVAVKLLANYGADINSYYNNNLTLLLTAVRRGEHDVVRALLEVNADISLRATEVARGLTAMMISIGYDQYLVGQVLHQFSFDQKKALRSRSQTAITSSGSVVNLYARDSSGMTSLMYAAQEYNRRFLQLLLGDEPSPRSKEMVNLQDNQGRTALHIAAMDAIDSSRPEQLNVLKILLKHGSDATIEDNEGRTVLHYASLNVTENEKSEQHLVLQLLIEQGAFVDAADCSGRTALHYAVIDIEGRELEEQEGVITLLLSKGANVNIKDNAGKTALHHVIEQEEAIKKKSAKERSTADDHPALRSAQRLKTLLKSEPGSITEASLGLTKMNLDDLSSGAANSNAPKQEWENTKHHKGNTETHMAAIISHVASVGSGAPHDKEAYTKQNKDGRTPLCLAAMHCNVEFLHSLSTDTVKSCMDITDNEGKTALHLAASSYQPEIIRHNKEPKSQNESMTASTMKMSKSGARKSAFQKVYELVGSELSSARDKLGNTALHCACLALNLEAVRTLIQDRKLLAITNNIGWTPLHCAIGTLVSQLDLQKSQDLIDELLSIESNEKPRALFYCDARGCSLLHLAVQTDRSTIIPQLVRLNPEQLNYDGFSPLHLAAARSSIETLEAMLQTFYSTNNDEFFRDVDHANYDGKTALFICIQNGDVEKIKLLLQYGANLARRGNDGTTVMHQVALASATNKKKTDENNDILDVILEHVVLWWCRQRNRLREVYSQDSPDYRAAYRDAVMELTCHMRCKGQNALQFAACNGAFAFLQKIMNTEGVFAEDNGETVLHYVAHLVPETMPPSFANAQPFRLMALIRDCDPDAISAGGSALENNRDDTSVLERIVNSDNAENAVSILNSAPFKQLVAPYWMIIEFIYFLLLLLHFTHMLSFTLFALPSYDWLRERFPDDEDSDFIGSGGKVQALGLFVDWRYTMFVVWPCVIFSLDVINAFSYWGSIRAAAKEKSKTEAEEGKVEDDSEGEVDVKMRKKLAKLVFVQWFSQWCVVAKTFFPSLMYSLAFVTSINFWFFVYQYSNMKQAYLVMTAVVLVIGWTYILNFLTIFKGFMTLVGVLRRILLGDIIRFFVVYSFVLVSFSLAFFVLSMQTTSVEDEESHSVFFTIYTVFLQMIGMEAIYDNMNLKEETLSSTYMSFIRGLFTVYVSISAVVFLNLLIAMMSDTYADAVSEANEAMRADSLRMVSRILLLERRLLIRPMKVILRTIRPFPLKKTLLKIKVKAGEESENTVRQWEMTRNVEDEEGGGGDDESTQEKVEVLENKLTTLIASEMKSVNDRLNSIAESLQQLSTLKKKPSLESIEAK